MVDKTGAEIPRSPTQLIEWGHYLLLQHVCLQYGVEQRPDGKYIATRDKVIPHLLHNGEGSIIDVVLLLVKKVRLNGMHL